MNIKHPLIEIAHELFPETVYSDTLTADLVTTKPSLDISTIESSRDGLDQYLVHHLFRKVDEDLGLDPERTALATFIAAMRDNVSAKEHLGNVIACIEGNLDYKDYVPPAAQEIIKLHSKIFNTITGLGGYGSFRDLLKACICNGYISGGATSHTRKGATIVDRVKNVTVGRKLAELLIHDKELLSCLPPVFQDTGKWVIIDDDEAHFVGKTAETKRMVVKVPSLNMFVMLGLHTIISHSLKNYGVDLVVQPDIHRALVSNPLTANMVACFDFTSASDTQVMELYHLLCSKLPPILGVIRLDGVLISDVVEVPVVEPYTCFGAMGHGYTQILQTAMFFSAALAVSGIDVTTLPTCGTITPCLKNTILLGMCSANGDDVTIASKFAVTFDKYISYLGLVVNKAKTLSDGPRRESCGADWVHFDEGSVNLEKFHAKRLPNNTIDYVRIANGLFRTGYLNHGNRWISDRFRNLHEWCIKCIPESERLYGPPRYGDVVIHSLDESLYKLRPYTDVQWLEFTKSRKVKRKYNTGTAFLKLMVYQPVLPFQAKRQYISEVEAYLHLHPEDEIPKGLLGLLAHPFYRGWGDRVLYSPLTLDQDGKPVYSRKQREYIEKELQNEEPTVLFFNTKAYLVMRVIDYHYVGSDNPSDLQFSVGTYVNYLPDTSVFGEDTSLDELFVNIVHSYVIKQRQKSGHCSHWLERHGIGPAAILNKGIACEQLRSGLIRRYTQLRMQYEEALERSKVELDSIAAEKRQLREFTF